ncbi:protein of unknown function [Hyphomicrobium sp. MC1]|nr:protein of unknown function [Hyphomicrobium sp. MC1]
MARVRGRVGDAREAVDTSLGRSLGLRKKPIPRIQPPSHTRDICAMRMKSPASCSGGEMISP